MLGWLRGSKSLEEISVNRFNMVQSSQVKVENNHILNHHPVGIPIPIPVKIKQKQAPSQSSERGTEE